MATKKKAIARKKAKAVTKKAAKKKAAVKKKKVTSKKVTSKKVTSKKVTSKKRVTAKKQTTRARKSAGDPSLLSQSDDFQPTQATIAGSGIRTPARSEALFTEPSAISQSRPAYSGEIADSQEETGIRSKGAAIRIVVLAALVVVAIILAVWSSMDDEAPQRPPTPVPTERQEQDESRAATPAMEGDLKITIEKEELSAVEDSGTSPMVKDGRLMMEGKAEADSQEAGEKRPAAPTARSYIVKPGDTLSIIASKTLGNSKRYPEIKKLNGLTGNSLNIGQKLRIPAK